MKKFIVIVKKEIRELLTRQVLLGMLLIVLLFSFLGNIVKDESRKIEEKHKISIVDLDKTPTSKETASALSKAGFIVIVSEGGGTATAIKNAVKNKIISIVVIPSDFEHKLLNLKRPSLKIYGVMNSFSATKIGDGNIDRIRTTVNEYLSSKMIRLTTDEIDPQTLKTPIEIKDHVIVRDRAAMASIEQISGYMMSQSGFVPVILFMIIFIAAQMTANAIASEKENKTLETLLSMPIDRKVLVLAKMVAAGLLALIGAIVYMFGFRYFMESITGGAISSISMNHIGQAVQELGLTLSIQSYAIIGVALFFTILCALAIATILGALAENVKGVQSLLMPLMIVIMMPYFLSMITDIGTLSPLSRYLMYAIPFTHAFTAIPNVYAGNYQAIIFGIMYEALFFAVSVYVAGRIYSSDKILTLKLRIRRPKSQPR